MRSRVASLLILIGVVTSFVSCAIGDRDLTGRTASVAAIGRPVQLHRPATLIDLGGSFSLPRYLLSDSSHGAVVERLQPGHTLVVDRVRLKVIFDVEPFVAAVGHMYSPSFGHDVEFYYDWGGVTRDGRVYVRRAAWEPLSTPKLRDLPSEQP